MKLRLIILLVVLLANNAFSQFVDELTPVNALPANENITGEWKLNFSDEFNGTEVNKDRWAINNSTKSRAARPSIGISDWRWKPDNVSIEGGKLILKVQKTGSNSMTNGSIYSYNKFHTQYGYFEARIKVADAAKGTHTAFWLQGPNMGNVDGTANDGAEIDIFETAWTEDYTKSVVHIDGYGANHKANTKKYDTPGIHSGFHTWGFHWTENFMDIYYDGVFKVRYSNQKWVVHSPEFLWLSNGASFGLNGDQYFIDQPIGFLSQTEVDYIRVWKDKSTMENDSLLDQSNWSLIKANSEDVYGNNLAIHAFDNKSYTFWHTEWKDNQPEHPHEIQINLGDTARIYGFQYLPRQDGNVNGNIAEYQFYTSNDSLNWGEPITSGTFAEGSSAQTVELGDTITCKYIRLVALSEINEKEVSNVAELNLLGYYKSDIPVGVNSQIKEFSTTIYPNPFSEEINVKINSHGNFSSWKIYSLDGQGLKHGQFLSGSNHLKIKTMDLNPGVYVLELNKQSGREATLIVKK